MADQEGKRKARKTDSEIHIDLGFGGLFKGLGNLMDVLSDLADKAEEIQEQTGEFTAGKTAKGEPIRGVYGFTLRTATGGSPKVESFGNIRETESGPVVADTREPLVDVFDENDAVVVVAELPGVAESEIEVTIEGDVLALQTTGGRRYAKEIVLPAVVDASTLVKTCTNGVLEIRAKKAKAAS